MYEFKTNNYQANKATGELITGCLCAYYFLIMWKLTPHIGPNWDGLLFTIFLYSIFVFSFFERIFKFGFSLSFKSLDKLEFPPIFNLNTLKLSIFFVLGALPKFNLSKRTNPLFEVISIIILTKTKIIMHQKVKR